MPGTVVLLVATIDSSPMVMSSRAMVATGKWGPGAEDPKISAGPDVHIILTTRTAKVLYSTRIERILISEVCARQLWSS